MHKHFRLIYLCTIPLIVASCSRSTTEAVVTGENGNETIDSSASAILEPISFNKHVRPILSENCWGCHGADIHEAEANFSLVSILEAKKETDSGLAGISPHAPDKSEAWKRITDQEDPMPPLDSHKSLSQEQKDIILRWIESGAKYEKHWAYITPQQTNDSAATNKSGQIDAYLTKHLKHIGLEQASEADPVTIIRRVYFDLTGLPAPTGVVDSFLKDPSADHLNQIIAKLVTTPEFGERLATYWFDLARFSDSVGYHGDQTHNSSNYRDWVIHAFNQNMPFDQFVQWQLAGDLIKDLSPDDRNDALVASCYNRLLQTTHEGGAQKKEYATIYDADRVRGVSGAFLGATIGCAQCHDHKFDPFTQKDFYSLAAFFSDIDDLGHLDKGKFKGRNALPTNRHPEMKLWSPLERASLKKLNAQLATTSEPKQKALLTKKIATYKPRQTMISSTGGKRTVRIRPRGNWQDESGPVVSAAVPEFMGSVTKLPGYSGTTSRLDLAQWLTNPKDKGGCGEITSRVFVNRVWYLLFGEGLCSSLDDFGAQGSYPNHPELLDYLAVDFASHWDIKKLFKTIMASRAYRMSSIPSTQQAISDPLNLHFSRQSRFRLQAEFVRDNALAISGLLVDDKGGSAAKPYQPKGYYQHLNFPIRTYKQSNDNSQWKRGVYIHWQRQFLHPMLKAFDAPSREECSARRPRSNTPLAALATLNDPTFVEAARVLAELALKQTALKTDKARVTWMLRRAIARIPTDQDLEPLLQLLDENRKIYSSDSNAAKLLLSQGLAPRDTTLDPTEHAAWTQVARVILNLHETITRH